MTEYFFHVHDGARIRTDFYGTAFDDIDGAIAHSKLLAAEFISELSIVSPVGDCSFEICDADGLVQAVMEFDPRKRPGAAALLN